MNRVVFGALAGFALLFGTSVGGATPARAQSGAQMCQLPMSLEDATRIARAFSSMPRSARQFGGEVSLASGLGLQGREVTDQSVTVVAVANNNIIFRTNGPVGRQIAERLRRYAVPLLLQYDASTRMMTAMIEGDRSDPFVLTLEATAVPSVMRTQMQSEAVGGSVRDRETGNSFRLQAMESRMGQRRSVTVAADVPAELRTELDCENGEIRIGVRLRLDFDLDLQTRIVVENRMNAQVEATLVGLDRSRRPAGNDTPSQGEGEARSPGQTGFDRMFTETRMLSIQRELVASSVRVTAQGDGLYTAAILSPTRIRTGAGVGFRHEAELNLRIELDKEPLITVLDVKGFGT